MDYILSGFQEAFKLILSGNPELYEIIIRSLIVSLTASIIASLIAIPIGIFLGLKSFFGKKIVTRLLYTFMSTPSVLVGLLVALVLSRRGPLGALELMYTSRAMVIAQVVLVLPLVTGLVYSLVNSQGKLIHQTGKVLGGNKLQRSWLIVCELKKEIGFCFITGFSRAISEVGAVAIVGGNIKNHTRVITTAIVMHNSMGDYVLAIALGLILLVISLIINSVLYSFKGI